MFFDRESTVVITKLNHLSETAIHNYCQKFGAVVRCMIKTSTQSRNKDPYALVKFAAVGSVTTILTNANHNIEGTHVVVRAFHQEVKTPGTISSTPQNQPLINNNGNQQKPTHYDQVMQENLALKYEIANLQKSLAEAQIYSKTAYDTFQALREKFEGEQVLTSKLKEEHAAMIESYEARLKQSPSRSKATNEKDKVKDEPMDSDSYQTNRCLEMHVIKDRLEQAQLDLGKCQTENAILQAKLVSREQQADARWKELNDQYTRVKKQYDHVSSCIKDFQSKLYYRKRLKCERKDEPLNRSNEKSSEASHDSNDDIVEIVMQVEPVPVPVPAPQTNI